MFHAGKLLWRRGGERERDSSITERQEQWERVAQRDSSITEGDGSRETHSS